MATVASGNEQEDGGDDNLADMDMSTSPTSSRSPSPTLPNSDTLPNVNSNSTSTIRFNPPMMPPWFVGEGLGLVALGGSSAAAMYMLGSLGQQYACHQLPNETSAAAAAMMLPFSGSRKEPIKLSNAVLYPPNPNAQPPPVRERPLGCRTVFVGGLPEKCTEEILRELMEHCGEIQSVRMSKKNFAHVRFINRDCIDRALYYSGYRMKVADRSDKEYTGRIHVDYAQARDDMHEWEALMLAANGGGDGTGRERSSTPPGSNNGRYNETEAAALLEKLKDSDTFTDASQLLTNWLDKGECNKKTSTIFYGMIAAVNAHVRRLVHDRRQCEAELREFREKHNQRLQGLMTQFHQIEKVFRMARKQKNWDHFSRAQRKNVDSWLGHAETIRKVNEEAMLRDRYEEEMETSDDEDDIDQVRGTSSTIRRDRSPQIDDDGHVQKKSKMDSGSDIAGQNPEECVESNSEKSKAKDQSVRSIDAPGPSAIAISSSMDESRSIESSQTDSRLIALLACFLNVHPFGATADYMWAYLRQVLPAVRMAQIENILERYPHLFRFQSSGIGATYERKWTFIGFQI